MRVLFTTTPGWGHIHPMVPLARAVVDRGDEVLWATSSDACARLEREGFQVVAAGLEESLGMAEVARRFPEIGALPPAERPDYLFPRLFGTVRTAPMLADLLPAAKEWGPAVIVSDAAEFAGPIVAAVLGVPCVTHSFGALLPAVRVEAAADAVAPLWEAEGLTPPPYAGRYQHLYLDIYPPSLRAWDASHVGAIQPLRPVTFAGSSPDGLPELVTATSSAPLVYVTFGTVFNKDMSLVATVVEALRDLPVRVVVTLGPAGPAAIGRQPANVHVARYIPQTSLLSYCALVVSHAGSGTFLATLAKGLPQLCLPQAADQFLNTAACERSGTGLTLAPAAQTADAIRVAAQRLLAEDQFRAAAQRVSAEIEAMPGPDVVASVVSHLAH